MPHRKPFTKIFEIEAVCLIRTCGLQLPEISPAVLYGFTPSRPKRRQRSSR